MKKTTAVLVVLVVGAFATSMSPSTASGKLIDLIPGLYGGEGIFLATDPAADHTAHFSIASAASINRLNEQIAAEVGGFPFSSSVGGFTFALEPVLGTFVRTTDTLGPLFAERAPTLGRGKFNFNLSYTFFKYHTFDGEDLDDLEVVARHDPDIIGFPDEREQFETDMVRLILDIDIEVAILALAVTYGITDRLDVGILVPFVHVDMHVKSVARIETSPDNTLFPGVHSFPGGVDRLVDEASDEATGLGDIVLRAKYHVLKSRVADVAAAVLAKLETGDEDNFLGTGDTTVRPFVIVSRTFFDVVFPGLSLTPHLNLGYELNVDDSQQNALEYVLGFDVGVERFAVAGEMIGTHQVDGDGIGDDLLNASVGFKWNPVQLFIVSANVQFPLNDDGLRSNIITTFGVEYSF